MHTQITRAEMASELVSVGYTLEFVRIQKKSFSPTPAPFLNYPSNINRAYFCIGGVKEVRKNCVFFNKTKYFLGQNYLSLSVLSKELKNSTERKWYMHTMFIEP